MSNENLGDEIPMVPTMDLDEFKKYLEIANTQELAILASNDIAYVDDFHHWLVQEQLRNANCLTVSMVGSNGYSILMPESDDVDPFGDLDTDEL